MRTGRAAEGQCYLSNRTQIDCPRAFNCCLSIVSEEGKFLILLDLVGLLVPAPARAEDVAVVARHGDPQRLRLHPDGPGVPRLGEYLLHRPGFVVLLQHVSGGAAVR